MLLPKRATTLLVKNSTPMLSLVYKFLPNRIEALVIDHFINTLCKEFIEFNELDFMDGRLVEVAITDLGIKWLFAKTNGNNPKDDRLVMINDLNKKADVAFSGSLSAMILMASQKVDPDTLFFNRELMITGDTNLGLEIKNLIDQFNISLLGKPIEKSLDIWSKSILEVQNAEKSVY